MKRERERKQHIVFSEKQDAIKRQRGSSASKVGGKYAVIPLDFLTRCTDLKYAAHALAEHYDVQVRTVQRWAERMNVEVWTPRGDSRQATEFDPTRDRGLLITAMRAFQPSQASSSSSMTSASSTSDRLISRANSPSTTIDS